MKSVFLIFMGISLLSLQALGGIHCASSPAPLRLFQIHHQLDNEGRCLQWKIVEEPNFIQLGIPSHEISLHSDRLPSPTITDYEFCHDNQTPGNLDALLEELGDNQLLSFNYPSLKYKMGILNSLTHNISRALAQKDIQQVGLTYFAEFEEILCEDDNSESLAYSPDSHKRYDEMMAAYYSLIRIITKYSAEQKERQFLPVELLQ